MPVFVGGSRSLSALSASVSGLLARALLSRGLALSVGCAAGADAVFVQEAVSLGLASRLSLFAVGGAGGAGFWSGSAVSAVAAAAAAGASVAWWAGGGPSVPLRGRLSRRSSAAAVGAAFGVFVLASPSSRGSLRSAALVAAAGAPSFLLCCGFPPGALALPAGLVAVPVRPSLALPAGVSCVSLASAQLSLF